MNLSGPMRTSFTLPTQSKSMKYASGAEVMTLGVKGLRRQGRRRAEFELIY